MTNPYASPDWTVKASSEPIDRLEAPFEVTFDFKESDALATLLFINEESSVAKEMRRANKWRFRKLAGWIALLGAFLWFLDGGLEDRMPFSAILCWIVAITIAVLSFRMKKVTKKEADKVFARVIELARDAAMFGRRKCSLDRDGIRLEEQTGERFRYWWSIDRIESTDDYLFIFLSDQEAAAVPARAFVNESRFTAFRELSERLWREGQRAKPEAASGGA